MPARLLVFFAERPARDWLLEEGEEFSLGRDPTCDLVLDDPRVSRRHARLSGETGRWRIADLGSKNGTAVGGVQVGEVDLPASSWLSSGGLPARFERLDEEARERLMRSRRERWQTTRDLASRLDPGLGREALLDRTLTALAALTDAERAYVLLAEGNESFSVARCHPAPRAPTAVSAATPATPAATGSNGSSASAGDPGGSSQPAEFAGSATAVARALASGRPVVAADALAVAELARRGSVIAGGVRALVCLPLTGPGRAMGALYADSRRPGSAFTELDLELLTALADHASLALQALHVTTEIEGLSPGLERSTEPHGRRPPR